MSEAAPVVEMIPIDQIHVLNPRSHKEFVFQNFVSNISCLGLKKPITVARRSTQLPGDKPYDLVCGQGRLEAFVVLGQREIPAVVIDAPREECFLMSLVENIARRHHRPLELLRDVANLRQRGYSITEIAKKIDLGQTYVGGVCDLLDNGEERLLSAVDKGRVPLSVAIRIAKSDEAGIQQALCEAYESHSLRGRKLQTVRRLIGTRKARGKKLAQGSRLKIESPQSAEELVKLYRQDSDRHTLLVRKAQLEGNRLLLVVSALKKLLADENFVTLLRAEGLDSLPAYLAGRIREGERG
jgi:ParB family transcriptional regulator, chromosome partitioning protein